MFVSGPVLVNSSIYIQMAQKEAFCYLRLLHGVDSPVQTTQLSFVLECFPYMFVPNESW